VHTLVTLLLRAGSIVVVVVVVGKEGTVELMYRMTGVVHDDPLSHTYSSTLMMQRKYVPTPSDLALRASNLKKASRFFVVEVVSWN
jgi:hypothetical protein